MRIALAVFVAVSLGLASPRDAYEEAATTKQPPPVDPLPGTLGYEWRGTPQRIANTTTMSEGELIFEDAPFDDTGRDYIQVTGGPLGTGQDAATLPLCSSGPAYRHGDFSYPDDPALADNAADLVEVRLRATDDAYHAVFKLETLIDPAKTVVGMGIDLDRLIVDGHPKFKLYEHWLEVTGTGATFDGVAVESHADAERNTYEAVIPRAMVPDGLLAVMAVAGLWSGSAWIDYVDLAYVDMEPLTGEPNCWQDKSQSVQINNGAVSLGWFDTAKSRAGFTEAPEPRVDAMTRLYQPSIPGEGTTGQPRYAQTSSARIYKGSMQPYTIYVPATYDPAKANPLIVLLHCLSCNHTIFTWASWPGLRLLAESRGAPIVTPLAYGEGGHYEGEAEVDVFDVLADVRARYSIDSDRIYLTGMSMGALGTYRLGLLYPDLWARSLGVGNYTNPFCVTPDQQGRTGCTATPINYFDILGNARNLPFGVLNGGLDELTPVTGARQIRDRFAELGYPHRYWEYPAKTHDPDLHGVTAEETDPWFGDFRRIIDPARVTYSVTREMDRDSAPFSIVHDRAYWVRDIRLHADAAAVHVDATSGRGTVFDTTPFSASGSATDTGPWTATGLDPVSRRVDDGNSLKLVVQGASSLTVRLADAGLRATEPLALDVDNDVPLDLRLDGWTNGATTLALPAGGGTVVLRPGESGASAVARLQPHGAPLPATGGSPGLLAGALLLALGIGFRRSRRRH